MTGGRPGTLACAVDRRRHDVRAKGLNGIDEIDVSEPDPVDGSVTLCVHFLGPVPAHVGQAQVAVEGGRRVRDVKVRSVAVNPAVAEDDDDCLEVVLDKVGDSSVYTLCLHDVKGFDVRYTSAPFTFTRHCASDLDCAAPAPCPPRQREEPALDYLAKDYAGFRRLILDRLALLLPDWRERHVPDLGITLVELLAYVGDHLSYHQDAVATEAYLDTARRRISVRRHGRLVDYALHEGANARAFVTVEVGAAAEWPASDVVFLTAFPGSPPPGGAPLVAEELPLAGPAGPRCFEPLLDADAPALRLRPGHNAIRLHTWGDRECCLPAGCTSASLVDDGPGSLELSVGDFLLFEEVLGPKTGVPGDADPEHRHVVRLTAVGEPVRDEVEDVFVREVAWGPADALPFALCLSAVGPAPACDLLVDVSVARGNVVPVDEGCRVAEDVGPVPEAPARTMCEGECQPAEVPAPPSRFAPMLTRPEVSFAEPLPGLDRCGRPAPAAALARRDPRRARPQVAVAVGAETWAAADDLLGCGPDDRCFVVEVDDDRRASLRFGDDRLGEAPSPGTVFRATYRVGSGPAGNVGAEAIAQVALRGRRDDVRVRVRNPLPATGGSLPESITEAKLRMPVAFRARRERAVTAEDYAEVAEREAGGRLQRASAELVWTGSWYEAEVALDPRRGPFDAAGTGCGCGCAGGCGHRRAGDDECDSDDVVAVVADALEHVRRMGHDLRVEPAEVVPVDLELTACVRPGWLRAHVEAALLDALSDRALPSGAVGFFHPDRWTFGDNLYVSQVVAAAHAVAGVESAQVTRLLRHGDVDRGELAAGVLRTTRRQVVALANDPSGPRSGRLEIVLRGGR